MGWTFAQEQIVGTIRSGGNEIPIWKGAVIELDGLAPGCSRMGNGDLFDQGLRQADIEKDGIVIKIGDVTINIKEPRSN